MNARSPQPEDAEAVTRCINALSLSDTNTLDYADGELAAEWAGQDLSEMLVVEDDDAIVGFLRFEDDYFEAYADPARDFEAVLGLLVDTAENRARQRAHRAGETVTIETDMSNEPARVLLEGRGFVEAGGWIRFISNLELIPPQPAGDLPIRSYVPGADDDLFYRALADGFGADWKEPPASEFISASTEITGYHPDLWLLAGSGGEVVGALQGFDRWTANEHIGWVRKLAVHPEARGKGVGRALLNEAQRRFADRGKEQLYLGVEKDNPTEARGFYERIGMIEVGVQTIYRKTIPAG